MDCAHAKQVYLGLDSKDEFFNEKVIERLLNVFPKAMERLLSFCQQYEQKKTNWFNDAVHSEVLGNFWVHHADDTDPVTMQTHDILGDLVAQKVISWWASGVVGFKVSVGNICCSGCSFYPAETDEETLCAIQVSAIKNNPSK